MIPKPGSRDWRELHRVLTRVVVPLALAFCVALLVVRHNGKSIWKLLGDPAAALHVNPLLGFFSNIGIIGWCAGASVGWFTTLILLRRRVAPATVRFHAGVAAFTTLLLLDDFFLIHDDLAQRYLGLSQNVVYAIYGVFFALLVVTRWREFATRNPALFVLAFGLLGFMAGIDAIFDGTTRLISVAMSGSKLLGIFAWSAWVTLAALRDIEAGDSQAPGSR